MPIANILVDAAAGHKVINFMDGNAGYNQFLWQKKTSTRLRSDVQDISIYLSG